MNVREKDAPPIKTPESQRPSGFPTMPEVTVCPFLPPLVHLTVSPTVIVTAVGAKNLSPIDTLCVVGGAVVVVGGAVVVVGGAVVVVGGAVVVVVGGAVVVVVGGAVTSGGGVLVVEEVVVSPVVSIVEDSTLLSDALVVAVVLSDVEVEPEVSAVTGAVEVPLVF